jgi:hypothetical protein
MVIFNRKKYLKIKSKEMLRKVQSIGWELRKLILALVPEKQLKIRNQREIYQIWLTFQRTNFRKKNKSISQVRENRKLREKL